MGSGTTGMPSIFISAVHTGSRLQIHKRARCKSSKLRIGWREKATSEPNQVTDTSDGVAWLPSPTGNISRHKSITPDNSHQLRK